MGFDILHFNLHKTFSQPHGGGGPGAGSVAVRDILEPYPAGTGRSCATATATGSTTTGPSRSAACAGSAARSACSCAPTRFIRMWGPGLREMSETAVLNANYMLARLRDAYDLPFDRTCMHEFVLSARNAQARARGDRARRRQAADGLRLPSAHGLLPAGRPRGADDRAHRDRGERDARRLLRRDARDRASAGRAPTAGAEGGAAQPAGQPPGRSPGGEAHARAPAPSRRRPA